MEKLKKQFSEAFENYPLQIIGCIPLFVIIPGFFIWGLIENPIPTIILTGIFLSVISAICILYMLIETDIFN